MAAVTLPTDPLAMRFPTLGSVIGEGLKYVYVIAGLILLIMLIMGGITLMTAAGDQNKTKQGYGMISSGLIGFLIIFISYFVAQIVQVALGVKFL
jgi:uncharacterized membrane protein